MVFKNSEHFQYTATITILDNFGHFEKLFLKMLDGFKNFKNLSFKSFHLYGTTSYPKFTTISSFLTCKIYSELLGMISCYSKSVYWDSEFQEDM